MFRAMRSGRCKLRRLLSMHFIQGTFVHILHIFTGMQQIAGVGGLRARMLIHVGNSARADMHLGTIILTNYVILYKYFKLYI